MKLSHICILCALILVGCAIPLSREPEPAAQQAASDDSNAASRSLPVEQASENAESDAEVASTAGESAPSDGDAAQPLASKSSTESSVGPADAAEDNADADSGPALAMTIDNLDLAALDRTFLEAISGARGEVGDVLEHRFIQLTDDAGDQWQGEALVGEAETILLMQPMQAGGQSAVRVVLDSADVTAEDVFANGRLNANLAPILASAEVAKPDPDRFGPPDADIQLVRARETSPGVWNFDVRLNHPDTGWEDYTDGWHVETLDNQILGVRILLHPHVGEMPFMRSQGGIAIPEDVTEVQVRSHDLISGYGVDTVVVSIGESGQGERYEVTR